MNNVIKSKKFKKYVQDSLNANQTLYIFPNGYGASVIFDPHFSDRGLENDKCEIAVLEQGVEHGRPVVNITYDTPVTSDVISYLDENGRDEVLERIMALPPKRGVK